MTAPCPALGFDVENDRVATRAWLASRADLRSWHVGDLEDLNGDDQ